MGKPAAALAAAAATWTLWAVGPAAAQVADAGASARVLSMGEPAAAELAMGDAAIASVEEVVHHRPVAGQIDRLIDRVVALHDDHGLRWSDTGGLIAVLEESLIGLDQGRYRDAAHQLGGFRDRISAHLADGSLGPDAAAPLLAAVADILTRVERLEGASVPRPGAN